MFAILQLGRGHSRAFIASVGIIVCVGIFLMLPEITGRSSVFMSIFGTAGRITSLYTVVSEVSLPQLFFGQGLDINPMHFPTILGDGISALQVDAIRLFSRSTESTVTGLIVQIGVFGVLLFYAALFWATLRDKRARPFYLTVAVCSLTINIIWLFPVNLLLGIAMAHSVWNIRNPMITENPDA